MEFTYQYSNFGVPGLGLKRGLADNVVIAPYATALAAMVDHRQALLNFSDLEGKGCLGRYGFYEALDFSRARLPDGVNFVIVKAYMAHHQGMTIVSIANTLNDSLMRTRFHREPIIQASELLLQERVPRDVAIAHPRAEEVKASPAGRTSPSSVRRLKISFDGAPITHLLSNGRYAVMLTTAGAGYSRWRDIAVTRWREDVTCDDWGSFIFLRNVQTGVVWSSGSQVRRPALEQDTVVFGEDRAEFIHREGFISTVTDVLVSGEDDGEVRRVSLTNNGRRTAEIELTSYAEIVLAPASADLAHQAFSKLFIQTEHIAEFDALIATRRPRSHEEPRIWAAHFAVVEGDLSAETQHETDRARFIGRGKTVSTASVVMHGAPLSNTVGTVLDPIFSIRRRVTVPAGRVVRVSFWTLVAPSRAELLDLIDKHHDRSAYDRAKTLAWTQAQVQLRHLDLEPAEAAEFQQLAAPILYNDRRYRPPSDAISHGAASQAALWPYAISGDLPIVVLRIDDIEDFGHLRRLLQAHEYWRIKRLGVDLVIINERASSYTQDLQIAIETAVRSSQTRPRLGDEAGQGSIFTLRSDLISAEARALLHAVARVVLVARRGSLAEQISRLTRPASAIEPSPQPSLSKAPAQLLSPAGDGLEFFNGTGGFDKDGKEYVIIQDGEHTTPAPWLNVVSNPSFGFQASADGSGFTWSENSRENQITPWSNDPVKDPAGEALYIRDRDSGAIFCPTSQPIRDGGRYVTRHGYGYSRFEHATNGISLTLTQFVALADPVKISRLTLRNTTNGARRLSVTAYAEWVLGSSRGASAPFIITQIDASTGALMARNPWSIPFGQRVAFSDMVGQQSSWTADRTAFLGRTGSQASPSALGNSAPLNGAVGAGFDPCAALQQYIDLAPGETVEVKWLLGQCDSHDEASRLIARYRAADLDQIQEDIGAHWRGLLGAVQVRTPDRAMDIMLNGWLLYQTLACRIMARTAFYQASGAYGFRDQLQDGMALSFAAPEETRRHLLRAAARQFVEGDVQHWWLPHTDRGVRSRISDDRVWLAFATATYIASSGDEAVLDERVPFLQGPILRPDEHESFYPTMLSDEDGSLFEHCARGLEQSIELTGSRGLPLIGGGDWNDGMNRVGENGRGESVWLGWLVIRTIALFAPIALKRKDTRAQRWLAHAARVREAIETEAWDGDWYRRATYDDGTWLGSKMSEECSIDSIAQSWAVLSGAADPDRAAKAMASVDRQLIRSEDQLALLFTPPFDKTSHDPGYIMGYPPGLRENGGQYSHAAMWAVIAHARLGNIDRAVELFSMINPIAHARDRASVNRYKVEPYVVAADIYSVAPHAGRGGWTWYTGAAGWMYRAGIEGILGIRRAGPFLEIEPMLPTHWDAFEATVTVGRTVYSIKVEASAETGIASSIILDQEPFPMSGRTARVPLDELHHHLLIRLAGDRTPPNK